MPNNDLELKKLKVKAVSGAASYFLRTLFLQSLAFGSVFILGIYFEPEDFGIYGFVIQIIGILIFFSDIGLAAALIQKKEEPTESDYKTAFTVQQLLAWVIVGVSLLLIYSGWVEEKTGSAGNWILFSLALSFPLASLKTIPSVQLERRLEFSKLVLPQIFENILFYGILLYYAVQGVGAVAYSYAILSRSIVGVIVMMYLMPWMPGIRLDKKALKELLGYGAKFQLNDFLARIKDQLFYLVLGLMLPLKEFGYVSWAKNWSMYPYNLTVQNMLAITFPTFSRLQGNKKALKIAIEKSLFFITLAIFPILTGMSLFIVPFVTVVESYNKWLPASYSLIFFSLSIGFSALSTPLTNTLNAIGEINKTLKLMILWTGLTWLITPILVYTQGYNGVALSAFIISITSVLSIYYVKKIVAIEVIEQVWRQLLASAVMVFVAFSAWEYWQQSLYHLGAGMLITGVSYGMALLIFGKEKLIQEITSLRK